MVAGGRSGRQVDYRAGRSSDRTGTDRTIDNGIGDNDIISRQKNIGGRRHFTVGHAIHHGYGIDDGRVANGKNDSSRIYGGVCCGYRAVGSVVDICTRSGAQQTYRQCIIIGARFGAEGRGGDRAHLGEVRNIVTGSRNRERIGRIVRYKRAVLCPVTEEVTFVGRGNQRGSLSVVVEAFTCHSTAHIRVGSDCDFVAIEAEVRHKGGGFRNCDCEGSIVGDDRSAPRPVNKGIALVRCSRQRGFGTVVIRTSTIHRTASHRVGRSCDGVAVELEVGNVGGGFGHCKGVRSIGRNHFLTLRPVHEVVARVGRGYQRGACTVVVGTRTCHRTASRRVGRGCDGVAVEFEVRHKGAVRNDREREGRISGHFHTALRPVHKVVARVGRGRQRGGCEVVVAAAAGHITAFRRVGRNGDGVADRIEVRY